MRIIALTLSATIGAAMIGIGVLADIAPRWADLELAGLAAVWMVGTLWIGGGHANRKTRPRDQRLVPARRRAQGMGH